MLTIRNLTITPNRRSTSQSVPQALLRIEQLQVGGGEVATIMGSSGSGKSTLLRWVLGEPLLDFDCQGELLLNKARIDQLAIHQRGIGLMHQQGDLFPHMTVTDNLRFAMPRHYKTSEREQRIQQALDSVGVLSKATAMSDQLSGGERSRVALLRSLLAEPAAILLDEPFSALDTQRRQSVREWTFNQLKQRNIPALLVTHDPEDLGDGSQLVLEGHDD